MIAGLLAAAVAVGVGQLVAGVVAPDSSPVVAVGEASIDLTPPPVKDFAISAFGTNDKVVLVTGILAVLAVFAAIVGALAVRKLWYGLLGLAGFTAIGMAAALTRPTAGPAYALATLAGGAAAAIALTLLVRAAPPAARPVAQAPSATARPDQPPATGTAGSLARPGRDDRPVTSSEPQRRRFLITGTAVAGTAAVAYLGGRYLAEGTSVSQAQAALRIPAPADPAPPLPAGSDLRIPGLS